MQAEKLKLHDFLHVQPETGQLFIRDERVAIVSSTALGTLRRDLIVNLGMERAKGFLKRYGWSIGATDAANLRHMYQGVDDLEWLLAGPMLHSLQGHAKVTPTRVEVDRQKGTLLLEGIWEGSYEADQHVQFFGRPSETVCWTLVGYASGYTSTYLGKPVLYKELECQARGDRCCVFVGKTVEEWGQEAAEELTYYQESHLAEELEAAYSRIRSQHLRLMRLTEIHSSLTDLILQGKGLLELTKVLGEILDCWVAVEDSHFQPLALYHPEGRDSEGVWWSMGPLFQKEDRKTRQSLERMLQERRGVIFQGESKEYGDRLASPIVTGRDVVGYISMGREKGKFAEFDVMALERASAICALLMLNERKILEVEQRLRGDFLEELLTGNTPPEALSRRARYMGLKQLQPYRILILQVENFAELMAQKGNYRDEVRLQEDIGHKVSELVRYWIGKEALTVQKRDKVLLFLSEKWLEDKGMKPQKAGEWLRNLLSEALPHCAFLIGVGRPYSEVKQLKRSYEEAMHALEAARGKKGKPVVAYEDLGVYGLLLHARNPEELQCFGQHWLGPLTEYDRRYQSELVVTLKEFLANDCNIQKTSRAMNISINGLRYRLQRIQEIGNIDLDSADVRFQLYLALQVYLMAGSGALIG